MHYTKERPAQSITELVKVKDGHAVTTSRKVAKAFGKNHFDVLRDIRNLGCSETFGQSNFALSSYQNKQGKEQPEYRMTKDGFVILAMGYTGERAMHFKELYIERFNEMERRLRNEFLPPIAEGVFKGLVPMQVNGHRLLCYTEALKAMGRSTRSGSVQQRRRRYGNHFYKLYGRNFITTQLAEQLLAQVQLERNAQALQLDLPFNEKGGAL